MPLRIPYIYVVGVFVVLPIAWTDAQTQRQLSVTEVVEIQDQEGQGGLAVELPIKCTTKGDLYVKIVGSGSEPGIALISEGRKRVSWFGLSQAPDLEESTFLDFATGTGNDLFLLLSKSVAPQGPVEYFVVRLKVDRTSSVTRLNVKPGLFLRQIALLGSDNFIVSGFTGIQFHPPKIKSFAAIFNSSGDFLKRVGLSGDADASDMAPSQQKSQNELSAQSKLNELLDVSSLQSGDDGTAYLTRTTPTGPIFLITSGGAVQRIALKPPKKGTTLSSVKVSGGKIVAEYSVPDSSSIPEQHEHFLTVTDVLTEQVQETVRYRGSQSVGVGLACYREQTFEFLTKGSSGHLQVVRAVAQ